MFARVSVLCQLHSENRFATTRTSFFFYPEDWNNCCRFKRSPYIPCRDMARLSTSEKKKKGESKANFLQSNG